MTMLNTEGNSNTSSQLPHLSSTFTDFLTPEWREHTKKKKVFTLQAHSAILELQFNHQVTEVSVNQETFLTTNYFKAALLRDSTAHQSNGNPGLIHVYKDEIKPVF